MRVEVATSFDPHPTLSQRERDLLISLMHELSIAVSIIEVAEEEAARKNATRVQIREAPPWRARWRREGGAAVFLRNRV